MGRTQNLRDFTVRIYPKGGDPVFSCVGTGFAVQNNNSTFIVTAAHVVQEAAECLRADLQQKEVGVYFPSAREDNQKNKLAKVAAIFDDAVDDILLLEVIDGSATLDPEQFAILGKAVNSEDNPFKTYGYAPVDEMRPASRGQGTIMGSVEVTLPVGTTLHAEPLELRSTDLRHGLSGSAVLDRELNLVIGVVTERGTPDTEYSDVGYAIDMAVLELEPFGMHLNEQAAPTRRSLEPRIDAVPATELEPKLRGAPEEIDKWVGRDNVLLALNADWIAPSLKITSLIGLAGEGKTVLVRHWIENLLNSETAPDGIFWWGFSERPDVPLFIREALAYMSNGNIDIRFQNSVSAQTRALGAMLESGSFLFIFDGLEALQQSEGDNYGLINSNDLLLLLRLFARPGHSSHCIITSRLQVLDLLDESASVERTIGPLEVEEGITLLKSRGVWGDQEELKDAVLSRGGHALTLSFLAEDVLRSHNGNIKQLNQLSAFSLEGDSQQHIQQSILSYYEFLSINQRWLLDVLNILISPVDNEELKEIVQCLGGFPNQEEDDIKTSLNHLIQLHLVYKVPDYEQYIAKAAVKKNYCQMLNPLELKEKHELLTSHYLKMAHTSKRVRQWFLDQQDFEPPPMSLVKTPERVYAADSRLPLMDAVYHACQAGNYDQAFDIYRNGIQGIDWSLAHKLGLYETDLGLLTHFFPDADLKRLPLVSNPSDQSVLINQVGYSEMHLGRPMQALPFFRRSSKLDEESNNMAKASSSLINAMEALIHLGELDQAKETVDASASLARVEGDPIGLFQPCVLEGWLAFINGDMDKAGKSFEDALILQQKFNPDIHTLFFTPGFAQALYFYKTGNLSAARSITEDNVNYCFEAGWIPLLSRCYRLLGQLDAVQGDQQSAQTRLKEALDVALQTSDQPVVIEALLACGLWEARYGNDLNTAHTDLEEALELCRKGSYRLYEADVRVALGWAYLASNERDKATVQALRASGMSVDMGYHWGKVDSENLLTYLR